MKTITTAYIIKCLLYVVTVVVFYGVSFAFADAATWYVRPEGGNYGTEDGTSYANAFDGFHDIDWAGSVNGGDTIYICGTHIRTTKTNGSIATAGGFDIKEGGTPGNPTILDGSCPGGDGEDALIWGAWKDERGAYANGGWQSLGNGVYYVETVGWNRIWTSSGLYENIDGETYDKYTRLATATDVINSNEKGVYYNEGFGTMNQNRIWVRPFNEATFKEEIRFTGAGGYFFWLGPQSNYSEIRNIKFYGIGGISMNGKSATNTIHHITFKDTVHYPFHGGRVFSPVNAHDITYDGIEIGYATEGIYVIWRGNEGGTNHVTIKDSYFHDIGSPWASDTGILNPAAVDGHAIGIQNMEYYEIVNNRFERVSSGIDLHMGGSVAFTEKHFNISGNYFNDIRKGWGRVTEGQAIGLEGHNDMPKGQSGDITISHNVILGCGGGIFSSRKDAIDFYNNTVANCGTGLATVGNRTDGTILNAYNNIVLDPTDRYFYFNQNATGIQYEFNADNNVYYPAPTTSGDFYFLATDGVSNTGINPFAWPGWRDAHKLRGNGPEDNTQITDPFPGVVTYTSIADITPSAGSPVIDSGADVGRTVDFLGNPIYGTPDRGAIEYQPPYLLGIDPIYENHSIRIYGDGKYRYLESPTPSTDQATLFIASGTGYSPDDYRYYADFHINAWNAGDDKTWTLESSGFLANDNGIAFFVGDLPQGATYALVVDGVETASQGVVDQNGFTALAYMGSLAGPLTFSLIEVDGGDPLPTPIPGCTDEAATNYNVNATVDNGSCTYPEPEPTPDATPIITLGLVEETTIGNNDTVGRFDIYADITAKDGDIYIADSMTNVNGGTSDESILFGVDGQGLHLATSNFDSITTTITSTAAETNGYFKILAGETETFTFRVTVDPIEGGLYRAGLATPFRYARTSGGSVFEATIDEEDFRTDYLSITGTTPEPTPIPGCTDEAATNYNVNATVDNGSCTYSTPNTAPVANDDTYSTTAGTVLSGVNVLSNDTDADDDTLEVSAVNNLTGSQGGTFLITTAGALTFSPGDAFSDLYTDESMDTTIVYTISDGEDTASADVTITVTGTKTRPSDKKPGRDKSKDVRNNKNGETNTLSLTDRAGGDCSVLKFDSIRAADLRRRDTSYVYDVGLFEINIDCVTPGDTVTVEIALDKVYDVSNWVLRKYFDDSETYITIDDSLVDYVTRRITGKDRTVIVYDITDGGPLDDDGVANGTIVDPVGPGEPIDEDPTPSQPSNFSGGGVRISLSDPNYNSSLRSLTEAERLAILKQIRDLLVQIIALQKQLIEVRTGRVLGAYTDNVSREGVHIIIRGLEGIIDGLRIKRSELLQ